MDKIFRGKDSKNAAVQYKKDRNMSRIMAIDHMRYSQYPNSKDYLVTNKSYEELIKTDKHMYELMIEDEPLYELYDLDQKDFPSDIKTVDEMIDYWGKMYFDTMSRLELTDKPNFVISVGTNPNKLSAHIINRNRSFKNSTDRKKYYNIVSETVIIDPKIVSRDFPFRALGQSKGEHPEYPLIKYSENVDDEFSVCCFENREHFDISNLKKLKVKESDKCVPTKNNKGEIRKNPKLRNLNETLKYIVKFIKDNELHSYLSQFNKCQCNKIDNSIPYDSAYCSSNNGPIHKNALWSLMNGVKKLVSKELHKKFKHGLLFRFLVNKREELREAYHINQQKVVIKPFLERYDTIFIQSNVMTFKSQQLKEVIKNYERCLAVQPRCISDLDVCSVAKYKDLKFESYKTTVHAARQSVVINSIRKIPGRFGLVILDELAAIIAQMISTNSHSVFDAFKQKIISAEKVVCLDANIDQHHVDFINNIRLGKRTLTVVNDFKSMTHLNIKMVSTIDNAEFVKHVKKSIKDGKNIVISSSSKTTTDSLRGIFDSDMPHVKCAYMHGDSELVLPSEWNNYNVIMYTSKMTTGISYSNSDNHFYEHIGFCDNSGPNPYDYFQMINRCRNYESKQMTLYYTTSDYKIYNEDINDIDDYMKRKYYKYEILKYDFESQKLEYDHAYNLIKEQKYIELLNKNNYYGRLKEMIQNHGFNLTECEIFNENEELKDEIKLGLLEKRMKDATEIYNARDLTQHEYCIYGRDGVINKPAFDKYKFKKHSRLRNDDKMFNPRNIMVASKHMDNYNRAFELKGLLNANSFDDVIKYNDDIIKSHKLEHVRNIKTTVVKNVDTGLFKTINTTFKKEIDNAKLDDVGIIKCDTHIAYLSLHDDEVDKAFKMKSLLELIRDSSSDSGEIVGGLSDIVFRHKLKLDFEVMKTNIIKNKKNLESIWNCKINENMKTNIVLKWFNTRLNYFGLNIFTNRNNHSNNNKIRILEIFKCNESFAELNDDFSNPYTQIFIERE